MNDLMRGIGALWNAGSHGARWIIFITIAWFWSLIIVGGIIASKALTITWLLISMPLAIVLFTWYVNPLLLLTLGLASETAKKGIIGLVVTLGVGIATNLYFIVIPVGTNWNTRGLGITAVFSVFAIIFLSAGSKATWLSKMRIVLGFWFFFSTVSIWRETPYEKLPKIVRDVIGIFREENTDDTPPQTRTETIRGIRTIQINKGEEVQVILADNGEETKLQSNYPVKYLNAFNSNWTRLNENNIVSFVASEYLGVIYLKGVKDQTYVTLWKYSRSHLPPIKSTPLTQVKEWGSEEKQERLREEREEEQRRLAAEEARRKSEEENRRVAEQELKSTTEELRIVDEIQKRLPPRFGYFTEQIVVPKYINDTNIDDYEIEAPEGTIIRFPNGTQYDVKEKGLYKHRAWCFKLSGSSSGGIAIIRLFKRTRTNEGRQVG